MQTEPNRIHVQLDALLDTRLGLMAILDPQGAVKMATSEDYFARVNDDFSKYSTITDAAFKEAWEQRKAEVLRHSIKTHIPIMLHELITRLEIQEETTPFHQSPELEINVWPYTDLTEEEREAIRLAVLYHGGIQTIPEIVCFPPQELTPRKIKREYSGLVLYDLRDWLQHHLQDFVKCPCPTVTVLAPALFAGTPPDVDQIVDDPEFRSGVSAFSMTELACIEFFQLNLLDVKYFSLWR